MTEYYIPTRASETEFTEKRSRFLGHVWRVESEAEARARIEEMTGQEVRVTVPGHMQRGGEPCPYDRVLSTRLGAEAALLIKNKEYGYMVSVDNNDITKVPLEEVAGKLKTVDPSCSMIREAKMVGICFGDE